MKPQIDVLIREEDGAVRVRKHRIVRGREIQKWGLSFTTGRWIRVPEGEDYPDECILIPVGIAADTLSPWP